MPTPGGEMRLGEAVQLLRAAPWSCRCSGGAGCCMVRERRAVELQRAGVVVAGRLAALVERRSRVQIGCSSVANVGSVG